MTIPARRSSAPTALSTALLPRAISLFVLGAAVIAWLVCIVPTGLGVRELAMFMGPGAILWISLGAAVHMVRRRNVSWRSLIRWTLLGAVLLPPVLAFLVGVAGLDRPTELLTLFTVGPWFMLIVGAVIGLLIELRREDRRELSARFPRTTWRRR